MKRKRFDYRHESENKSKIERFFLHQGQPSIDLILQSWAKILIRNSIHLAKVKNLSFSMAQNLAFFFFYKFNTKLLV